MIHFIILAVMLLVFSLSSVNSQAKNNNSPQLERIIVVLKGQAGPADKFAEQVVRQYGGHVGYLYQHVFNGFSISVPQPAINQLTNNPNIDFISVDRLVSHSAQTIPTGISRTFAANNLNLAIDAVENYQVDVDVAVLDTGIDQEHPDLNLVGGTNCLQTSGGGAPWRRNYYCDDNVSSDDDHYHGTHVAGIIAAIDNDYGVVGIAPGARLWAVKILNESGSGYDSGIIKGIDWVINRGDIEVINMSIGGSGQNLAYQTAINNARDNGITVVVSAGNESDDASNYSPAYVANAITVSSLADFDGIEGGLGVASCDTANNINEDDTLSYFSNWGSVVDITAPGSCIYSTVPLEYGSYGTLSGTSMAAPYVAGAAALLASGPNPLSSASDVDNIRNTLVNTGNFNWVDDSGDLIQEPLLDVSVLVPSDGGATGNVMLYPPTANYTYSCNLLDCSFDATSSSDSDGIIVDYQWDFGDGNSGNGVNVSHSYASTGNYNLVLTVTDDDSLFDQNSMVISVSSELANVTPDAQFTVSCTQLSCSFDASESSDSDGNIVAYQWLFGDANSGTGEIVDHTYAASGSYNVQLTVRDDANDETTATELVSVTISNISLTAVLIKKPKGQKEVVLTWSGAQGENVDIHHRTNSGINTVIEENDGEYIQSLNSGGNHYYQVCEVESEVCSPEVLAK